MFNGAFTQIWRHRALEITSVGPLLTTLQYVMYFRFCGWGHVSTQGGGDAHTCSKWLTRGSTGAKSDVYSFFLIFRLLQLSLQIFHKVFLLYLDCLSCIFFALTVNCKQSPHMLLGRHNFVGLMRYCYALFELAETTINIPQATVYTCAASPGIPGLTRLIRRSLPKYPRTLG